MKIYLWPFCQEEQLSVNGERMCTKYWLTALGRLAQEQCGLLTDCPDKTSAVVHGRKALNQTKQKKYYKLNKVEKSLQTSLKLNMDSPH